jgi:hypothetical protein
LKESLELRRFAVGDKSRYREHLEMQDLASGNVVGGMLAFALKLCLLRHGKGGAGRRAIQSTADM